jgi:hypothetical protein
VDVNYVRGRSFQTGNVLTWDEDSDAIQLQYLTQSDLKGWIPAFAINMATASVAPDMVKRIVAAAKE